MVPAFDPATGALPPGIHEATWVEVVGRFGTNDRRRELLQGMREALLHLARVGCRRIYLGGSFITAKEMPGDWDACYEPIPASTRDQSGRRRPMLDRNIGTSNREAIPHVLPGGS